MYKILIFLVLSCFSVSYPVGQASADNTLKQSAHFELVDVLLKYGLNPTSPAINQAMEVKDYEAVNLLIEHGANLHTRGSRTSITCIVPTPPLDKTNVRELSNEGKTVLEIAIERRKKSLIKQLLSKGADPYSKRQISYILYDAPSKDKSYNGPYEQSTRNRVDYAHGSTSAMYELLKTGDLELLSIFAEAGINFNKPYLDNGTTPLQLACALKNKELMQFLLDHGAKI